MVPVTEYFAEDDILLPLNTLPHLLGISLPYVYELIRQRKIPALKVGNRLVVKKAVINKILDSGTAPYLKQQTLKIRSESLSTPAPILGGE